MDQFGRKVVDQLRPKLTHTGRDVAMVYDAYLAAEKGDPSGLAVMSVVYDLINPATMMTWGESGAIVMSTDFDPARDYFTEMNPPGSILGAPQSEFAWSPWKVQCVSRAAGELRAIG